MSDYMFVLPSPAFANPYTCTYTCSKTLKSDFRHRISDTKTNSN